MENLMMCTECSERVHARCAKIKIAKVLFVGDVLRQ